MHALIRPLARTRVVVALIVASAALFALMSGLVTQRAHGASDGSQVSGNFSFSGSLLVGCPPGALLCTHGSFDGGLSGTFTLTLLTTVPSIDPGINYFTGSLAMRNDVGTFNCTLNGALDSRSSSEGEFGEICVINNGTGRYLGAKGDLRLIGTSTSKLLIPTGAGEYQGHITTP